MRKNIIAYWIATGIMCLVFLFSAGMYLLNYEMVTGFFKALGFPVWLIYPMATLKILGIIAVVTNKSNYLKELAYAGFLFNGILAFTAHIHAKDGGYLISLIALVSTAVSWFFYKRLLTLKNK
jgi:hypothetical protein